MIIFFPLFTVSDLNLILCVSVTFLAFSVCDVWFCYYFCDILGKQEAIRLPATFTWQNLQTTKCLLVLFSRQFHTFLMKK